MRKQLEKEMKVYKLTTQSSTSQNKTLWGVGVTHSVTGDLRQCKNGIHAYSDPLLAQLLNPIHADISDPILWECEASDEMLNDNGLKSCHRSLTTLRQIPLPLVSTEQCIRFAILCTLEVCDDPSYVQWAHNWLSGVDRSEAAAWAAEAAARAAEAVARAAKAAARAAEAAAAARPIDLIALARKAVEG
jgi:hypothetical protein